MPKERIRGFVGPYQPVVGWSIDGDVQVGVEEASGFSLITMLYGDPDVRRRFVKGLVDRGLLRLPPADTDEQKDAAWQEIGRVILDEIEGSAGTPAGSYTGVWSTLDRGGCNLLIRTLRRARDAAYGRDE